MINNWRRSYIMVGGKMTFIIIMENFIFLIKLFIKV